MHIGVKKDSAWLRKDKFLECPSTIEGLAYGEFDGRPGSELAITLSDPVDSSGATKSIIFVDMSGDIKNTLTVRCDLSRGGSLSILDVDGDGLCEFLQAGDLLLAHDGRLMANIAESWNEHVRPLDFDHDGVLDFYSANGSRFTVVNRAGELLQEFALDAYLYDARMIDFDNDKRWDRVYLTQKYIDYRPYEYKLHIESGNGNVSRTLDYPQGGWSLTPYPGHNGQLFLLQYAGKKALILPLDGSDAIAELEWDERVGVNGAMANTVRFSPNEETLWIAIYVAWQGVPVGYSDFRLRIFFFGNDGHLEYDEVLDSTWTEAEQLISVAPAGRRGDEALLVAEHSTVWRYSADQ